MKSARDRIDVSRLVTAARDCYAQMEPYRKYYADGIRQTTGPYYGPKMVEGVHGAFNLLQLTLSVFQRHLTARNPRVLVRTRPRRLRPEAANQENVLNDTIKRLKLKRTIRAAVGDAFAQMGVVKIGRELMVGSGTTMPSPGSIFVDQVSFDDYVFDTTAKTWDQIAFDGNRYSLPLDTILATDIYDGKVRQRLENARDSFRTRASAKGELASNLAFGAPGTVESYCPMVPLIDTHLKYDNAVVTLVDDSEWDPSETALFMDDWIGPRHGPYRRLSFQDVPSNIMPLPPMSIWRPMSELAAAMFKKVSDQARKSKKVFAIGGAGEEDADRIANAADGTYVRVDHPELIKEMKFDGIDPSNLNFVLMLKMLYSWLVGNLDAVGGLGPQADTLGQEEIMVSSASKQVEDMQDRVVDFVAEIAEDIAWYRWHDDDAVDHVIKRLPGTSGRVEVTAKFDRNRLGGWGDYDYEIAPYSMQHTSPAARMRTLGAVMQQYVLPLLPLMREAGMTVNVPELMRIVTRYTDMEELDGILESVEPLQQADMAGANRPTHTHRTYERRNSPGRTTQGTDAVLMQSLLGKGVQPSEASNVA